MNLHYTSLGRHLQQTGEAKRSLIQQNKFLPLEAIPQTLPFFAGGKKSKENPLPPCSKSIGSSQLFVLTARLLSAVVQTDSHSSHGLSKINYPT